MGSHIHFVRRTGQIKIVLQDSFNILTKVIYGQHMNNVPVYLPIAVTESLLIKLTTPIELMLWICKGLKVYAKKHYGIFKTIRHLQGTNDICTQKCGVTTAQLS